jgi:hypothetical protein
MTNYAISRETRHPLSPRHLREIGPSGKSEFLVNEYSLCRRPVITDMNEEIEQVKEENLFLICSMCRDIRYANVSVERWRS